MRYEYCFSQTVLQTYYFDNDDKSYISSHKNEPFDTLKDDEKVVAYIDFRGIWPKYEKINYRICAKDEESYIKEKSNFIKI